MKKFSELEFVQNLSWKQVLTYITLSITTIIGATWTIATRTVDSKADYVNMRYTEISSLEKQIKELHSENNQLKTKLGIQLSSSSSVDNTIDHNIKEMKLNRPIIDKSLDLIYSVYIIYSTYVYLKFTFNNGETENKQISIGSSLKFSSNNKNYQFILLSIDTEKSSIKYMIRDTQNN